MAFPEIIIRGDAGGGTNPTLVTGALLFSGYAAQPGDIALTVISVAGNRTLTTPTPGAAKVTADRNASTPYVTAGIFYKTVPANGDPTFTVNFGASTNYSAINYLIRGGDPGSFNFVIPNTSSSINMPNLTASIDADNLWILSRHGNVADINQEQTPDGYTGYLKENGERASYLHTIESVYKFSASKTENPGSWSGGTSAAFVGYTIVILGTPGGSFSTFCFI